MIRNLFVIILICAFTQARALVIMEEFDSIPDKLRSAQQYEQLVDYLTQKKESLESKGNTSSYTYALTLLDLSRAKAHIGDFNSTSELDKALDLIESTDVDWTSYWIATLSSERDFLEAGALGLLLQIKERQKNYCLSKYGEKSGEYHKSLWNLVERLYSSIGDDVLTERYCREGLEASASASFSDVDYYYLFAMVLDNIYTKKAMAGEDVLSTRIDLNLSQLKRTESLPDFDINYYLNNLYSLASLYNDAGEYEKAILYSQKGIAIAEEVFGKESSDYTDMVTLYLQTMRLSGRLDEVVDLLLENLERRERFLDKNDDYFLFYGRDIASNYADLYKYDEAIRITNSLLDNQSNPKFNDSVRIRLLEDLASYKLSNEDFAECINILESIISEKKKKNDYTYLLNQNSLSRVYTSLGDYMKVIELDNKSLKEIEMFEKDDSVDSEWLRQMKMLVLLSLSGNYNRLGNTQKAAFYQIEHLNTSGEVMPDVVMNELMAELKGEKYVYSDEDIVFLDEINRQELETLKEYGRMNTPEYAWYLQNLAAPHIIKGDYEKALLYLEESINEFERLNYTDNTEFANLLEIMANCNNALGNKNKALELLQKSLGILNEKLPKNHPDILNIKSKIAILMFHLNDSETLSYLHQVSEDMRSMLITVFAQLTSVERNMYWEQYKDWFQHDIYNIVEKFHDDKTIEATLDGTLLAKGLLLNTDIEFYKLISESNDPELLNTYFKLVATRSSLNRESGLDPQEYQRKEIQAQKLEKELIESSKYYGDYTRNLNIRWQQIQEKLSDKSVAVEFIAYKRTGGNYTYAAYLIMPGNKKPELVQLFDEVSLKKIPVSDYYRTTALSKLVWGSLDVYLNGAENVYFSPAGELYNINIECLPNYSGEGYISDRFKLFRLSSTRELAVVRDKISYSQAALYGGMKYDTETSFLADDMKKYPEFHNRDLGLYDAIDDFGVLRGGAYELPGTVEEINNIGESFSLTSINPLVFKGLDGTEASFKSLSGKKINLMHIATHGFYWTEAEASKVNDVSFLRQENNELSRYMEDKALTRSGLLFSGANNALRGILIPDGVEDGILTAKEISRLDLRELDLVALSACQTGLGEISGDGVFGLQRGFKKAGANTLLMSLWKVDDRATQILMSKFYQEFLNGKSKFESLRTAQQFLRNYEEDTEEWIDTELEMDSPSPEYNETTAHQERLNQKRNETDQKLVLAKFKPFENPKFWAAFILLDALN